MADYSPKLSHPDLVISFLLASFYLNHLSDISAPADNSALLLARRDLPTSSNNSFTFAPVFEDVSIHLKAFKVFNGG